jgi:hypothetical protein
LASRLSMSWCSMPPARRAAQKARAAGEVFTAAKAYAIGASTSRSLRKYQTATTFILPKARVTGLVTAKFLQALGEA